MGRGRSISGDYRLTEGLPGGLEGERLAPKYQQYRYSFPRRKHLLPSVLVPARPASAICHRTFQNIPTQMVARLLQDVQEHDEQIL